MNKEQIKELYNAALVSAGQEKQFGTTNLDVAERFAELIVAECIDAAIEAQADFYMIHNIKSRFGIEE